jgi:hypothetical protein
MSMTTERDPDEVGWPEHVHGITTDGLGKLGVHSKSHELFWDGKAIVTKQSIGLEGWTFGLAAAATIATVVSALWPIAVHLGWFGLKAVGS